MAKWTPERLSRLFLGPEQILCYACATWAGLIAWGRLNEVRRQRKAFHQELLPTDEGARILPEDARPLIRRIDQTVERRGPSILATMSRMALGKFAVSRSAADSGEVVRVQAEVEQGRMVAGMATVNYLAWAIPAIAVIAALFAFGYPRVGATISFIGAIVAMLTFLGGGYGGPPPAEPVAQLEGLAGLGNA